MSRLKTLRVRFALGTAGLLLIVLLAFGVLVYFGMARGLIATIDDSLRLNATQAIAGVNSEDASLNSLDGLMDNLEGVDISESGFTFRVLDSKGQILQEIGAYKTLPIPYTQFTDALQKQITVITLPEPDNGDSLRVYLAPIIQDNQVIGVIQVAHNLEEVDKTLEKLLVILWLGIPFLVIFSGIGSYFLATYTLTPIDKITRTARQISTEDLSARLNLPLTDDEVGRLAATLDSMLARLDTGFQRERRFVADASHELRTPLTAMQTILNTTLAYQRTPTEYEQALVDLAQETDRMRTLTEGLLQLAKNESATQRTEFEPINLSTLLQDVTDTLCLLAEDKGLSLSCNVSDNLTLMGDSDGLIRLFVNLLGNAIKYTEQGEITVNAWQCPTGAVEVTIADTGIGIAPEHLPHIFERFYRVEESRSTDGSGLGLAIALLVAHTHNGTITVNSNIGKGTSFSVQLATG